MKKLKNPAINIATIQALKDQFITLKPSKGGKGKRLKKASHELTSKATEKIFLKIKGKGGKRKLIKTKIEAKIKLEVGPASAIFPFSLSERKPKINTAPGITIKNPKKLPKIAKINPKSNFRNSAKQPYL